MWNLNRFVPCNDLIIYQVRLMTSEVAITALAGILSNIGDLMTILPIFYHVILYAKIAPATAVFINQEDISCPQSQGSEKVFGIQTNSR
jgi:hypothetical protein